MPEPKPQPTPLERAEQTIRALESDLRFVLHSSTVGRAHESADRGLAVSRKYWQKKTHEQSA